MRRIWPWGGTGGGIGFRIFLNVQRLVRKNPGTEIPLCLGSWMPKHLRVWSVGNAVHFDKDKNDSYLALLMDRSSIAF